MRKLTWSTAVLIVLGLLVATTGCSTSLDEPASPETDGPANTARMSTTTTATTRRDTGPDIDVTVDLATTHQVMDGFGTSARVWSDPHLTDTTRSPIPDEAQEEILRLLYTDLGLTRLRSVLERGMEPVNDDTDPGRVTPGAFDFRDKRADAHIDLVKDAIPFGLTDFFGAPVRLEPWMDDEDVDEYVEWASVMLTRWRDLGAEPPYFSPVNEPGGGAKRSGVWLREVVKALGTWLEEEGFSTRLVIPDDIDPRQAYERAKVVLDDPEARRYVGAVAYHLYGGVSGSEERLAELAREHGLPLWMTEYSLSGPDVWPETLEWARLMQRLITQADVSAVDYMWGFFGDQDENALISLSFTDGTFAGYEVRPVYYVIGQFSRFVRPGAVRVGASSEEPISVSAFAGEDDEVIMVMVNTDKEAHQVHVAVEGGELIGRVQVSRTSASESGVTLEPVGVSNTGFSAELAGESVTTFVGRRG